MVKVKGHRSLFHHSVQVTAPFPSELLLSNAIYCCIRVQKKRTPNTQLMKTKTQSVLVNEMNRYYLDVYVDAGGVPDPVVVDVGDGGRDGVGENFEWSC